MLTKGCLKLSISIIHVIVGSLALIYGMLSLKKIRLYFGAGKIVKGVVKDVKFNGKTYFPVVQYYDEDSPVKNVIIKLNEGSKLFNYEIGTTVELVCYKDENKDKTKLFIKSWILNYGINFIWITAGIIFILYGFIKW